VSCVCLARFLTPKPNMFITNEPANALNTPCRVMVC
jgi:ABC-type Mn2+/Zn2+ transport system ATPase subunit